MVCVSVVVVVVTTPPRSTDSSVVTTVVLVVASASRYSLKRNHISPSMQNVAKKENPCAEERGAIEGKSVFNRVSQKRPRTAWRTPPATSASSGRGKGHTFKTRSNAPTQRNKGRSGGLVRAPKLCRQ